MDVKPVFEEQSMVQWDDCDMFGRLTLAGLNNIITVTAGNHAMESGIGYSHMKAHKQAWVLIRLHISMKYMPVWRDIITCRTWVAQFNGILSERMFQLLDGQGKIIGEASSVWSVINYELRAPQQMLAKYDLSTLRPDKKLEISSAAKIKLPVQTKAIGQHKVVFSDIDAMQHANNTKYTEWIYNCLPVTYIKTLDRNLDLHYNYISELVMGEDVDIKKGDGGVYTISRRGEEKPCFALKVDILKEQ